METYKGNLLRKILLLFGIFFLALSSSNNLFAAEDCTGFGGWGAPYVVPNPGNYCQPINFSYIGRYTDDSTLYSETNLPSVQVYFDGGATQFTPDISYYLADDGTKSVRVSGTMGVDNDPMAEPNTCLTSGSHNISVVINSFDGTKQCTKLKAFSVAANTCDAVGSWSRIYSSVLPLNYCVPFQFFLTVGDSQGVGQIYAEFDGEDIRNHLVITREGLTAHITGTVGGPGACIPLGEHTLGISWTDSLGVSSTACQRGLAFDVVYNGGNNGEIEPIDPTPIGTVPKTGIFDDTKGATIFGLGLLFLAIGGVWLSDSMLKYNLLTKVTKSIPSKLKNFREKKNQSRKSKFEKKF